MKTNTKIALTLLTLASAAGILFAQDSQPQDGARPQRSGGGGGHRPPPPPLMAALDANHDGVIDASEIANASAALKTLDKNGDGKLTQDEIRPQRPQNGQQGDSQNRPQSSDQEGDRPMPPQENP